MILFKKESDIDFQDHKKYELHLKLTIAKMSIQFQYFTFITIMSCK